MNLVLNTKDGKGQTYTLKFGRRQTVDIWSESSRDIILQTSRWQGMSIAHGSACV